MGIENLDEYKKEESLPKKRELKYLNHRNKWLAAVYNPKNFRRNAKLLVVKENKSDGKKILIYILAVGFGFFMIIIFSIFK